MSSKKNDFNQKSQIRCKRYRKKILEISQQVSALHIAPAFSCTEIVDVIYNCILKKKNKDIFLMSKGHGCMIQYVILEEKEILKTKDLDNYCKPNGILGAHPDYENPGIEGSTGSLGHGLGICVGMAYAEKLKKSKSSIFSVLSDGECQEGSTWEAAMMAGNLFLDNLIIFVDVNDFSGLERMSEGHPAFHPLKTKFQSFGWEVFEVDGHNSFEIFEAYSNKNDKKPLAVICNTIKGKGISFMENIPIWHYRSPNKEEYLLALKELNNEK